MAEDTSSVSKGCFLIKKSSARTPRKRHAEDIFPDVAGENTAHRKQRCENYKKCWESIKYEIEVLQSQMNSKIFSDLLEFFKRKQSVKSSEIGRTSVIQEIPTAALITGVNMPDHDVVFSQLATELNSHVTPFVALLRSKDCTVMKATMKNVISQFIGCDVHDGDDLFPSEQAKKISSFTMPVLCHWYQKMIKYSYPKRRQNDADGYIGIKDHKKACDKFN
ncbi:origin recognition complex subunit 3-like [Stylophora pistillata]|uniref:origin recognition complex subunit 3-like n=1 Tax=Stylophora pistillata TaxID=50429 RepID=UPI000C042E10|nr:origin recognition complex subunit 3-like [Stylophora pistillata]